MAKRSSEPGEVVMLSPVWSRGYFLASTRRWPHEDRNCLRRMCIHRCLSGFRPFTLQTMDYQHVIEQVMSATAPRVGAGKVADYIPDLARVDPGRFGVTIATVDGEVYSAGDAHAPFAIESISKAFTLALVLSEPDCGIWTRVHREPSGTPFNSLIQLE